MTLVAPVGERDPRYALRGREYLVDELLGQCLEGGDGRLHVLHGMSGCGKTAVALELAFRLRTAPGCRMWWVDARHSAMFTASMHALARHLGLASEEVPGGGVADALWEKLESFEGRWLLVIDNVEDLSVLDGPGRLAAGTGWLRPHRCPGGMVVALTCLGVQQLWGANAVLHPVRPLAPQHAAQVLLDRAGHKAGSVDAARRLATRLGALPLALCLAGSYLAEVNEMPAVFRDAGTPSDFCSYQRALDECGTRLNPALAVADAWQLSVDLLHQMGLARARLLLTVLAAFGSAAIPYTLLLRPSTVSAVVAGCDGMEGKELWHTLRELAALGLVDTLDSPDKPGGLPCVRLHPLIRDIARADTRVAVTLIEQALALDEVRLPPEDPQSWPIWQVLSPHALELLQYAEAGEHLSPRQRNVCADAAELAARYLQAQGLFAQARKEFERVLVIRQETGGAQHLNTITTRHNLAQVLQDLGDLSEAETTRTQVWGMLVEVQGKEHPDALTARHELGRLLHDRGRLTEAETHLRAVFEARLRIDGPEGACTLAARHELARVFHDRGDLHAARQEFAALTAIRRRRLGVDHPSTATARHNHACVLHDMGRLEEARSESQQVLQTRKRLYGNAHPKSLATAHLLAVVLHALSATTEAGNMLRDVCDISVRLLGADHPQTRRYADTLKSWEELGGSSDG
ncbi:tetratricopeptide repeat protein [Streptomyces sp. NPDC088747]|uniref:tetratricopeptide repeat protein n=1 Tax=Streptomyces sp. NPDC088747 TaxID=3365886 RepID=UPI0037FB5F2A